MIMTNEEFPGGAVINVLILTKYFLIIGCVSHLQSAGHSPVTAISWHVNGSLLLSSSASDSSLILWNTASETKVPLRRMGAGFHLVISQNI